MDDDDDRDEVIPAAADVPEPCEPDPFEDEPTNEIVLLDLVRIDTSELEVV